jgi:hypothetical protein
MNQEIIIGLLSGSLGTLILKELFNQYNKRKDFDRELTKFIYERKIDAAEKAISFYSSYMNRIVEIKQSFEVIKRSIENNSGYDGNII